MISAYNPTDKNLSYHNGNHLNFAITLIPDGGCTFGSIVTFSNKPVKIHGYFMWFAWTIVGIAQIWTGRYLVHWWRWRQFTHSVLGSLIGILTVAGAIIILKWIDWGLYFDHVHNVAG